MHIIYNISIPSRDTGIRKCLEICNFTIYYSLLNISDRHETTTCTIVLLIVTTITIRRGEFNIFLKEKLKASRLLWVNTLGGSLFHWAIVRGKTVSIIVVRGGYLSVFVWVVGSCLAVSGYEVLIGIDVYKIVGYFV